MAGASAIARLVKRAIRASGYDLTRFRRPIGYGAALPEVREEFRGLQFAARSLQKLIDVGGGEFETVLDIGCGAGDHARILIDHGKRVTAVDYGKSPYFDQRPEGLDAVIGDFNEMTFDQPFDAVWASHVLEHQLDVHRFLLAVSRALREGGWLAVTVPPGKDEIVGGHVSLWNGGLLLYRLVLAGFDCRTAAVCRDGYNVAVVVQKRSIEVPELTYDAGDVGRLAAYLPEGCDEGFQGDIVVLNW